MASRFWPGKSASQVLGRRVSISGRRGPFFEIVGIVPSAKHSFLTEEPRPFVYLPFSSQYRSEMTVHTRMGREFAFTRNRALLAAGIRTEVRAIDNDLPLSGVGPMVDRMSFALVPIRIAGIILGIAGILVLMLAAVGVYGVASFAVVNRTREVGIRLALGAEPRRVQALLVARGMLTVLAGTVVGITISAFASKLLKPLLIGVSTTDPVTLATTLVVLIGVALLANYIPTRQAVRIDPAVALREE